MTWAHVAIEAHCLWSVKEDKGSLIPELCKSGPGNPGIHCLSINSDHTYCPFLGFAPARGTIILIGSNGEEEAYSSFESEEIDEEKWLLKEREWVDKWKQILGRKDR